MDPQHLLVRIVKVLSQLKIPCLITGGMAVYVWGRPRFTKDKLDFAYLKKWAKKQNNLELLEEMITLIS